MTVLLHILYWFVIQLGPQKHVFVYFYALTVGTKVAHNEHLMPVFPAVYEIYLVSLLSKLPCHSLGLNTITSKNDLP